jgi:hypothetical protein
VTSKRVDLSWQDNASNEDGFYVQRSSNNGKSWTTIAKVDADVQSHSDTAVSRKRAYVYRVFAFNSDGNSAFSSEERVNMPSATRALIARKQKLKKKKKPKVKKADLPSDSGRMSPQGVRSASFSGPGTSSTTDLASVVDQVFVRWSHRRGWAFLTSPEG